MTWLEPVLTAGVLQVLTEHLLTLAVMLLAISQYFLARRQRLQNDRQTEAFQHRIAELETQLTAVNHGAVGVGKRLIRIEQLMHQKISAEQKVRQASDMNTDFDLAARLSGEGASVSEIVRKTGLSRPEAELVMLMNGHPIPGRASLTH